MDLLGLDRIRKRLTAVKYQEQLLNSFLQVNRINLVPKTKVGKGEIDNSYTDTNCEYIPILLEGKRGQGGKQQEN